MTTEVTTYYAACHNCGGTAAMPMRKRALYALDDADAHTRQTGHPSWVTYRKDRPADAPDHVAPPDLAALLDDHTSPHDGDYAEVMQAEAQRQQELDDAEYGTAEDQYDGSPL
jgi:hypothetical protein